MPNKGVIKLQSRLALHQQGKTDGEIAQVEGVARTVIAQWRHCNGLPCNKAPHRCTAPDTRRKLYDLGLSDTAISKREGITQNAITGWRERHGLPRNAPRKTPPVRHVSLDGMSATANLHHITADPRWSPWLEEMGATVW